MQSIDHAGQVSVVGQLSPDHHKGMYPGLELPLPINRMNHAHCLNTIKTIVLWIGFGSEKILPINPLLAV
jgi:hypothetical protein